MQPARDSWRSWFDIQNRRRGFVAIRGLVIHARSVALRYHCEINPAETLAVRRWLAGGPRVIRCVKGEYALRFNEIRVEVKDLRQILNVKPGLESTIAIC